MINPIIAIAKTSEVFSSDQLILKPSSMEMPLESINTKMINGDFGDWNCATMIKYINATASSNSKTHKYQ